MAVSGASFAQMVLLLAMLARRLGTLRGRDLAFSISRTIAGSLVAAVGGWGAARLLWPAAGAGQLERALPGIVGSVVFAALFFFAAWGVRAPELDMILGGLRRRLGRRASRATGAS